jgi:hypothetical protein
VQLRGCCRSDKKKSRYFRPAGKLSSRSTGPAVWRQPTQTVTWACARFSLPARCERVRSGDALGPRSVVYFFHEAYAHEPNPSSSRSERSPSCCAELGARMPDKMARARPGSTHPPAAVQLGQSTCSVQRLVYTRAPPSGFLATIPSYDYTASTVVSSIITRLTLQFICRCLVIRYLKYDRRKRKSVRLISCKHNTRGF